jgi:hypothetical protein
VETVCFVPPVSQHRRFPGPAEQVPYLWRIEKWRRWFYRGNVKWVVLVLVVRDPWAITMLVYVRAATVGKELCPLHGRSSSGRFVATPAVCQRLMRIVCTLAFFVPTWDNLAARSALERTTCVLFGDSARLMERVVSIFGTVQNSLDLQLFTFTTKPSLPR